MLHHRILNWVESPQLTSVLDLQVITTCTHLTRDNKRPPVSYSYHLFECDVAFPALGSSDLFLQWDLSYRRKSVYQIFTIVCLVVTIQLVAKQLKHQ